MSTHTHTHRTSQIKSLDLNLSAAPPEADDTDKQDISVSWTPVYSELWFILLLTLLGLFLLAVLLGLLLRR